MFAFLTDLFDTRFKTGSQPDPGWQQECAPHKQGSVGARARVMSYAAAILLTAIVFVIRCLLDPVLDGHYAITPFLFAMALSAWYGGWKPGLLCLVSDHVLSGRTDAAGPAVSSGIVFAS